MSESRRTEQCFDARTNAIAEKLDVIAEVAMLAGVPPHVQWAAVTRRALHFRKRNGRTIASIPSAGENELLCVLIRANDVLWIWWHGLDPRDRELRSLRKGTTR